MHQHPGMFAGIDVGHVIDQGVVHDDVAEVDSTGASWVRINLRLDQWNTPDPAWFAAYDEVIDAYVARGIEVYALINDEAVSSDLDHNSDAWIAQYVQNATAIVDHFKNRVRTFEIINEPNDYAGGSSARFTPHAFAKILQDTYLAVKHDAGHDVDRCWQVSLVSGPLFSFDDSSSADYLAQVYSAGRSELAWDYTHQATGSYPLDGIGYHMYVAQGLDSSDADVGTQMTGNLSSLWSAVTAQEGDATGKRIWVSEFGWQAGVVGADVQAARMQAGFAAMRDFGKVQGAIYFNYRDFPGASYGVFDDSGARRPAADMLATMPAAPHAAAVTSIAMPALAPGELGDAVVTVENRGSTTWVASDGFRLGAAPGCPDAAAENAIAWEPTDGYANGITDARVYLPHDVAPGESIELHVPVRAPAQAGTYTFAARMVHEGVTWFGATATAPVTVADHAPGDGDATGDGATGDPHTGGCAAGGSASLWILAGLLCRKSRRTSRKPTRTVP